MPHAKEYAPPAIITASNQAKAGAGYTALKENSGSRTVKKNPVNERDVKNGNKHRRI
jgi:hypothetical protein